MKPLRTYPDPERLAVDWLADALEDEGETVTVGVPVPADWSASSTPHVQVACDGQELVHPVATRATMRVTTWAHTTTDAKRLAALAQAVLLTNERHGCTSLAGPVATHDPETRAELATFSVVMVVRSDPTIAS